MNIKKSFGHVKVAQTIATAIMIVTLLLVFETVSLPTRLIKSHSCKCDKSFFKKKHILK